MEAEKIPVAYSEQDKLAKKYETTILVLCSILAGFHVVHFLYLLVMLDRVDKLTYLSDDGRFSASAAFEFTALIALFLLTIAPVIVSKFKDVKLFREEMAIEYAKNYAVLTATCCVYTVELVVFILDALALSRSVKVGLKYSNNQEIEIAGVLISSIHIVVLLVCTLGLACIVKKYYEHNHERGSLFIGKDDNTTKHKSIKPQNPPAEVPVYPAAAPFRATTLNVVTLAQSKKEPQIGSGVIVSETDGPRGALVVNDDNAVLLVGQDSKIPQRGLHNLRNLGQLRVTDASGFQNSSDPSNSEKTLPTDTSCSQSKSFFKSFKRLRLKHSSPKRTAFPSSSYSTVS